MARIITQATKRCTQKIFQKNINLCTPKTNPTGGTDTEGRQQEANWRRGLARWAHNPKVPRSKLGFAILFLRSVGFKEYAKKTRKNHALKKTQQRKGGAQKKKYPRRGLNSRSSACKADVMTTRPLEHQRERPNPVSDRTRRAPIILVI